MIIFALTVLSVGVVGALGVVLWAVKGSIGHNTPEHGLPSRTIMRRYMLMGLYCNRDDPRNIVEHPRRNGITFNLRSEVAASALWIFVAITIVGASLLTTLLLMSS
jgi:uncharacterized membrane protein